MLSVKISKLRTRVLYCQTAAAKGLTRSLQMARNKSAKAMNGQMSEIGDRARSVLNMGDAAIALQKDVLQGYAQFNREWLACMQTEVTLWSDLVRKLSATASLPEAVDAYAKCVSQQMQVAAEHSQHLLSGYHKMTDGYHTAAAR
jgi:hypothetical protein